VAEENALVAGKAVFLGLVFDLEKGWHTYWINPGDSGAAPRIEWQLPPSFRTGEIRWPIPKRLDTSGVIDYGYEDRLLLMLPLHVPSNYKPGTPVALTANVRYLVCREVCIPARAQVSLQLPAKTGLTSDSAARRHLFASARERWPKPVPAGWKIQASEDRDTIILTLETGSRETQASFFPLVQDQIDNVAPQQLTPAVRGARLVLKKHDPDGEPIAELRGVLVMGTRAVEIAVPVSRLATRGTSAR
jgi:thiol:disulfide interchange protein DsbD